MRLTNAIKDEIRKNVYNDIMKARHEAWKEEWRAFAQEAADNQWPEDIRKWIASAPEGWVHSHTSVDVILAREDRNRTYLRDSLAAARSPHRYPGESNVQLQRAFYVPASQHYDNDVDVSNTPYQKRGLALQKAIDKMTKDYEVLMSTVNDALAACNTDKQLRERYEDLAKYLPVAERGTGTMLAVTNDSVRKVLKCASQGDCASA